MYKKPQLQMKNICYCYDGKNEVLKNVNLDIFAGEKIAIMGANGAGKSTLFLCMNGVLFTEKGDMIWEGEKIIKKNRKQLTKNIGIVFQEADNQIIATTVLEERKLSIPCIMEFTTSLKLFSDILNLQINLYFMF